MRKTTKFDKVVAREICQVTTKASCIYGAQMPEARSEIGTYLYAVAVKVNFNQRLHARHVKECFKIFSLTLITRAGLVFVS